MKTNIALIGFMGAGKTAVGYALARKLNKQFVEIDSLIEKKAGKSISDIFQQEGEITFRELEIETTSEVSRGKNLIIACGGGIVLNKINIDRLRQEAIIVYLTASPWKIFERTKRSRTRRPLLEVADPALTIRELMKFRKPCYERASDIQINTSKLDIDSVAEQIIARAREYESFNS